MTAKTFLLQASASRPRSNHFKNEHNNIPLAPVPIAQIPTIITIVRWNSKTMAVKRRRSLAWWLELQNIGFCPQDQDLVEDHLLTTLYLPTTPIIFQMLVLTAGTVVIIIIIITPFRIGNKLPKKRGNQDISRQSMKS